MTNAVAMIERCFAHQHPDEFGRDSIAPCIVNENSIRFEATPEGMNQTVMPPPETSDEETVWVV